MQARSILETCLYVDDLEKAEDFYVRVLGLVPFAREKGRHVFFHCGDAVFLLFNPEATVHSHHGIPAHGARGAGHAAFRMNESEIDAWRAHLNQSGVEIETEYTWPTGGFSIYFRDPAGNSIELATPRIWGLKE
ncbi:VOC family protein [Candidatus Sumerlaeota bacterium]|nr:VOC family protein [Candidatus Sumerlaeota bacterium]